MKAKSLIRILLVVAMCVLLISSCALKPEYVDIPTSLSLSVGETYDFGLEVSSLSSDNDFVATIEHGAVVARHAGKCIIRVSNDLEESICNVTVSPNTTLYSEPIRWWGISKSALISVEGYDYKETDNIIGYMMNSSTVPVKMFSSCIIVNTFSSEPLSERLSEHLHDRYQPIAAEGDRYMFMDSYSMERAETIVYMIIYSSDYRAVIYMDINYFESINSLKSKISEDLFSDIIDLLK